MFDNWYETMEIAKMRNEAILEDMHNIRMSNARKETRHSSRISIYLLGGLGKAFSSLGDSLQSHYHFDSENKSMRKVS